jgi:hypothetical protein
MLQGRFLRGPAVSPAAKATILVLELEIVKRHLPKNEVATAIILCKFGFRSSNERNVISKQKTDNKLIRGLYTQALFS